MTGTLSPINLAQHGREFLDAARRERAAAGRHISLPAYFLAGRAIELALKAFLVLKGQPVPHLRKLSHDLGAIVEDAQSQGLETVFTPSPEQIGAIQLLNPYYQSKDLEYPTTGFKSYPDFQWLESFAQGLIDSMAKPLRAWSPPQ